MRAAPTVPAVPEFPVELAVPDVGAEATARHRGENRIYPLSARDRMVVNAMENFLKSIGDPFTQVQAHDMLRSIPILVSIITDAAAFLQVNDDLGCSLFVGM